MVAVTLPPRLAAPLKVTNVFAVIVSAVELLTVRVVEPLEAEKVIAPAEVVVVIGVTS